MGGRWAVWADHGRLTVIWTLRDLPPSFKIVRLFKLSKQVNPNDECD